MLRGKVKWFSKDKGYGYITHTQDGAYTDYFFHISSVIGPDSPRDGDLVEFQSATTKKGVAGQSVRIIERAASKPPRKNIEALKREDDRVECKHCGKRMVPRLQYKKGEPVARLCPYCMKSQEEEGWSGFIIIAVISIFILIKFII